MLNYFMSKERKIEMVVTKVSFAEAEEADIAYYASIDWKESVATVEEMRRQIWSKQYKSGKIENIIKKAGLKEERDEFE